MIQRQTLARGGGSALAALAALFTTLCCLGSPALIGLLSALGAGFLLRDRYLEPLLAATRQHHRPGPFILSFVAAGTVFFAIYGIGLLPHAAGGDSMADGMTALPSWSPYLAYGAILALLGAQVWDLWLYRRCGLRRAPVPTHAPASPERREEGI
jgi:mercuric ion transport protein